MAIYTSDTEYKHKVARGLVANATTWNKFGYNLDVDTTSSEVVASFGGSFQVMTSADTLDVVSDSANDVNTTGTGARTIGIIGIDETGVYQFEVVNLNGVTPVTTSNQWLGVNRVYVLSSGSSNFNEGTISITDTSASFGTQAQIPAEESVTQQCIFHTEVGSTFLLDVLKFNVNKLSGSSPKVTIKAFSFSRTTETRYEIFRDTIDTDVENHILINMEQPLVIGGNEVLYFEAETTINDTIVNLRFSGILYT